MWLYKIMQDWNRAGNEKQIYPNTDITLLLVYLIFNTKIVAFLCTWRDDSLPFSSMF